MNTRILLLVLCVAAFSSCSSVYKSGQTPDDVYFSPARPQADTYVDVRQEKQGTNYQTYEQYQDSYRDDRFLRMSVGNPYYLNAYNSYSGFDWRYNSFYDGFNYGFNSPWNNYFAWNNFYNPYGSPYLSFGGGYGYGGGYGTGYYGGGYGNGGIKYTVNAAPPSRPVVFDVRSYSNNGSNNRPVSRNYSNTSTNSGFPRYNNTNSGNGNRTYYNNNSNSGSGNRSIYTPSNNNSGNNSTYTPSRSYTPSSSSGSSSSGGGSSSSGGGGGGGVSRPTRGN